MTIERLPIVWARMVPLALVSSLLCLAQTAPAPGKFVGTWKENEAKQKIGSGVKLRFRRSANGGLEELRGPEARPLVQPVNFDGKPYTVDSSKNTLVWKQIDPSHFERTLSEGEKLITTRRIQISADGKSLTEVTEIKVSGRKDLVGTAVYKRSSGDAQGLVGIWKLESVRTSEPPQQKIEALGTTGLRITNLRGVTQILTLDGKPTPVAGPAVISGSMVASKLINGDTIEETLSREGVVTGKTTMALSKDGKTLTATSVNLGPNAGSEPSVSVFEKQ